MARRMSENRAEVTTLPALVGGALIVAIATVWVDVVATCAGWR